MDSVVIHPVGFWGHFKHQRLGKFLKTIEWGNLEKQGMWESLNSLEFWTLESREIFEHLKLETFLNNSTCYFEDNRMGEHFVPARVGNIFQ